MKKLTLLACAFALVANTQGIAQAQTYGGITPTPYCISTDATVSNPAVTQSLEFIDNIQASGTKYAPNTTAVVRIIVRNSSNAKTYGVVVNQEIPQYFRYFSGPGTLSADGRNISINFGDMDSNTEKITYVTLISYKADELPVDKSVICSSTKIVASASNCNSDTDTAQLCIGREVTSENPLSSIKEAPKAGPAAGLAIFAIQAALGAAGIYLRRRIG